MPLTQFIEPAIVVFTAVLLLVMFGVLIAIECTFTREREGA